MRGLEFELQCQFGSAKLQATASIQNAVDGNGSHLANSPRQLPRCNYSQALLGEQLQLGMEIQYLGKRQTLAGNTVLNGQFLPNGLRWSAGVHNLLDQHNESPMLPDSCAYDRDRIKQAGRQWNASLTIPW